MKYQTINVFLLQLVVMIGIRKSLDFVFTKKELQVCGPGSRAVRNVESGMINSG
jgi:hypothetical protein